MVPFEENICLSGGAEGADLMFGMCAGSAGHTVIHFHFRGHKSNAPPSELVELTKEQLEAADQKVVQANIVLKRHYPTSKQFVNNLLRRNWYQVESSERCYAVSSIKNGQVQGGTAWATTMYIQKHSMEACECYVFCQDTGMWYKWEKMWLPILDPPAPHGIWTGIGSRDVKQNGKDAIRKLLNWSSEKSS